jgi:hypothetical protein
MEQGEQGGQSLTTAPKTRAGWLKFLREHGQEAGGVSNFAAILGTYPIKIKEAVDPLIGAGYVNMVGKPGRGGGFKYILTSMGFRYLNENQEELDEEDNDNAQAKPPTRTPEEIREAERPVHPWRASTPVPPSESRPQASQPETKPPSAKQPAIRPDLDPALKDALFDELFERFGDQVSAKQLLDRMKANVSRAGDE